MIDIIEYSKEIDTLDKMGIIFDKVTDDEIFFNCNTHPYLPEPNDEARTIWGKMGNIWHYDGKKLIIGRLGKWERPSL